MELRMTNGFCEMNEMEMQEVDGGGVFDFLLNAVSARAVGDLVAWDLANCYAIGYGSVMSENKK